MEGLYAEASVKKKKTLKENVIRFGLYGATVAFFVLAFLTFKTLYIIIGLILLGLVYYLVPRLNVEWEYVFCDGQLDFDRISGGAKRKTMMRVDFEHLIVLAPKNSHALDGYRHNGVEVKDFTGLNPDAKVYGMAVTGNERTTLIYFEPSEKMLAAMKQKSPRKIVEY